MQYVFHMNQFWWMWRGVAYINADEVYDLVEKKYGAGYY